MNWIVHGLYIGYLSKLSRDEMKILPEIINSIKIYTYIKQYQYYHKSYK